MARILVTGGAGFIGSNFVHYWVNQHPNDQVVVLDALTYAGNLANLAGVIDRKAFTFVRGDIRNDELVEKLMRAHAIDTIVHFAAESHVDRSIVRPDAFIETNVLGTHSLLKTAHKLWIREKLVTKHRFHHVSTDEVYGSLGPKDAAFSESTPYAPNSPYSASKAASDHLVRAYHHTYGLNATTSNCSNNYGPYHFPEKLIPLLIVNTLLGRSLPIYGNGRNVRDWLYVTDHCRAIDLILAHGRAGEVYNVGGGAECQNIDIVHQVCCIADDAFRHDSRLAERFPQSPAALGRRTEELITFVSDRPGHDRRYAIDFTKATRELGFRPSINLADGLANVFAWYLENEQWWRGVLDGSYASWIDSNYMQRITIETEPNLP